MNEMEFCMNLDFGVEHWKLHMKRPLTWRFEFIFKSTPTFFPMRYKSKSENNCGRVTELS